MLPALEHLVQWLGGLPGIGSKSALRLGLHLIEMPTDELDSFLQTIQEAKKSVLICGTCFTYSQSNPCMVCQSPYSEEEILCVVENRIDVFALQKQLPPPSKFHVLGGKLSPLNGITPSDLNIEALLQRLDEKGPSEIILATGADVEGEATAQYVANLLDSSRFKVSRIAFGVSVGGGLSLADERSIQKSLAGRTSF